MFGIAASMNILFWLSVAWLFYIYAGYPPLLWVMGSMRKVRFLRDAEYRPAVSVLISARNEEKDIGWKVAETLAWNYPRERLEVLVASDASKDRTEEILRAISDPRFRWLANHRRLGKNISLVRLAEIASGELLFFTDANSHITENSLTAIARHFADPKVGCVTSCERPESGEFDGGMSRGEGFYQRYESWINSLENRIGSVLTCDGSIFCIRRNLFTTLDPDLANDLELPLRIGAAGFATLFEVSAFSTERATSSAGEEFDRRRRICAQGFLAAWRLKGILRGVRVWQFASRKLLRWLALIPILLAAASSAYLAGRSHLFAFFLIPQIAFGALALAGWGSNAMGRRSNTLTSLPFFFLLIHVAALLGIVQTCFGRRFALWESPALSRGRSAAEGKHAAPAAEGPAGLAGAESDR